MMLGSEEFVNFAISNSLNSKQGKMEQTSNKFIMVSYKLYTINASGEKEMVEEAPLVHPYQFITGMGMVIDSFEDQIKGLSQGDSFDFVIPCDEAYGQREEEHVIKLGREVFEVEGSFDTERIYAGAVVPLVDSEGHQFNATIVSVDQAEVTVDLNNPLSGFDLNFVGKVVDAREATQEEIQGVINMMSGQGCGCGCEGHEENKDCGGCGGGCGHEH